MNHDLRGIGKVYARDPIGAVLQIGWRRHHEGRWGYAGSFGFSESDTIKRCFHVMTAVTDRKVNRGGREGVARSPHPDFQAFNTAHPSKCMSIRAVLVNRFEADAYRKVLGAYRAPAGGREKSPEKGYWCRGDGQKAYRYQNGEMVEIKCLADQCQYQQEGTGAKGKGTHCRCNLTLLAQFRWRDDKFPQIYFEWSSKGWTNAGYLDGLFKQVDETARLLGYAPGAFPLTGLPLVMTLSERTQPKRRYPVVSFSIDGDLFAWMGRARDLHAGNLALDAGPQALALAPPEGYTAEQMEEATEASLTKHYKPSNERKRDS